MPAQPACKRQQLKLLKRVTVLPAAVARSLTGHQ
jgi:hypothetical protein